MGDRILRFPEVYEKIGVSNVSLWRWEKVGRFPKRVKIGPNAAGWIESEVDAWIEPGRRKGKSCFIILKTRPDKKTKLSTTKTDRSPHPQARIGGPVPESPPWEDIQLADKPYARFHQEMMGIRQWVFWKAVEVPGKPKPTKVPIDALTSHQAKVNDPKTWCGLNDAANYFDEWKDAEHVHVNGKTGAEVEGKIMGVGFSIFCHR